MTIILIIVIIILYRIKAYKKDWMEMRLIKNLTKKEKIKINRVAFQSRVIICR